MPENVVSKELLADGRIVCYRFASTGQEAAAKWYNEVTDLFLKWDSSKPLLLLLDLCAAGNLLSADMMRSARDASHQRTDVPGRTAVIVLGNQPSQNIKMLLDNALADTRERQIFDDEAKGVAWLLETEKA
jgi:hypothetical protein